MAQVLTKIVATIVVDDKDPKELLELFDGLIAKDGLIIKTIGGRTLIGECVDSEFVMIAEVTEDDEIIWKDNEPKLKYYPSMNNKFKLCDMIRLEGIGDHSIVTLAEASFLYNLDTRTVIDMGKFTDKCSIEDFLLTNYPDYIVLRKIK